MATLTVVLRPRASCSRFRLLNSIPSKAKAQIALLLLGHIGQKSLGVNLAPLLLLLLLLMQNLVLITCVGDATPMLRPRLSSTNTNRDMKNPSFAGSLAVPVSKGLAPSMIFSGISSPSIPPTASSTDVVLGHHAVRKPRIGLVRITLSSI
jgi:hypothetical protein